MYPFTTLIKAAFEAIRATSPQGSAVNQLASEMKQGMTLLDAFTADTPAKRIQAIAALLSEYAYANSDSEKERLTLTLGNVILLVTESAQYMQNANQPGQNHTTETISPAWLQSCQQKSLYLSGELKRLMREKQETRRQVEEVWQGPDLQKPQYREEHERYLAELGQRLNKL